MASDTPLSILVIWSRQRRFISLSVDVDLMTVENAIRDVYQIEAVGLFREYQIQFYDRVYRSYVDLYAGSLAAFRQLLRELRSSKAQPNGDQTWQLRIILRATPMAHIPEQFQMAPLPSSLRFSFELISSNSTF